MLEVQGKYNKAKIFTDNIEQEAISQIIELCNQEFVENSKIRIMPDCHAGAGCVIGTTMTIQDKVVPNLVGVDIGCGMLTVEIGEKLEEINFDKLDSIIRTKVPNGFGINNKPLQFAKDVVFDNIIAPFNKDRAEKSVGSLGGGNHFIELNVGKNGNVFLVIHTGSRNLGKQIAEHYQKVAYNELLDLSNKKKEIIENLQKQKRFNEIEDAIKNFDKNNKTKIPKDFAYVENQNLKNYLNDMKIAQHFATTNRLAIATTICVGMRWSVVSKFETIHNYIDMETMMLRKGAISAYKDELVLIPMNMRDGSIVAIGKGNEDWNNSAPHGAGRIMSRSKAKQVVSFEEFKESMSNVWTTSVLTSTLDEAPMVYKQMNEIIENTKETVDIVEVIKPVYNFKAN